MQLKVNIILIVLFKCTVYIDCLYIGHIELNKPHIVLV